MGQRQRDIRGPDGESFTRQVSATAQSATWFAVAAGVVLVALAGFAAGRLTAGASGPWSTFDPAHPYGLPVQYFVQNQPQPLDPRELIPLPGPDAPGSNSPNPGSPQQAPEGEAQCPLYFYQDGQFFEMQPGGPGRQGPLGGNPELFPLEPLPGAPPAQPSRPPQQPPQQPPPGRQPPATPDPPPAPSPFFALAPDAQATMAHDSSHEETFANP